MTKIRRASQGSGYSSSNSTNNNDIYLSSRTRKSISKSRRSSACCGSDEKPPSRRASLVATLLSMPSFNEDGSQQIVTGLDIHAMYKLKISRTCRKLDGFFGEPAPVDVCISEIKREGLKAMLESKIPLCYFLHFLLEEFSSENLFFFLQVEQFEKQTSSTLANCIYDKFICSDSDLEVNLDDRVKRNICSRLSEDQYDYKLFNEAKSSVYILLESSFLRFLHSSIYQEMIRNCGELTIHYGDHVKRKTLLYLQQKQADHNVNSMLQDFIKNIFE